MTDAAFERDMIAYLTERGYRVTKARTPRVTGATATRKLRKEHGLLHGAEQVDGCPLCAFRADARAHAGHAEQDDTCRFCTYEQVAARSPFPSTLRRLPEQARYNRAYRTFRRARARYGAGTARADYRGHLTISGHPRVAHLQALLDRLSNPSTWEQAA